MLQRESAGRQAFSRGDCPSRANAALARGSAGPCPRFSRSRQRYPDAFPPSLSFQKGPNTVLIEGRGPSRAQDLRSQAWNLPILSLTSCPTPPSILPPCWKYSFGGHCTSVIWGQIILGCLPLTEMCLWTTPLTSLRLSLLHNRMGQRHPPCKNLALRVAPRGPQWLGSRSCVPSEQTPGPERPPHLVDVELALPAGQLPVAGGELPNEVVAAKEGCR